MIQPRTLPPPARLMSPVVPNAPEQPPGTDDRAQDQAGDQAGAAPPPEVRWEHLYPELKALARSRLRRSGAFTLLDTTALVNQSCVRLIESGPQRLDGMARRQFFSYAAAVMRSVVVDLARERLTDRRGNGEVLRIDMLSVEPSTDDGDPLVIDRALTELRAREPRLAEVVEMRFFGGFSETEIADALGLSERSVRRDWEKARTLMRMLLA